MFTLQNMEVPELEIPGLKLISYGYKQQTAKFDLSLNGVEKEERLFFTYEYSTEIFKEETIRRYVGYFQEIIDVVLANRDTPLSNIDLVHNLMDSESHIYRDAAGDFGFPDFQGG
jgi:surfactin family lipopeptide synthetase B/lichenysin synthetase B